MNVVNTPSHELMTMRNKFKPSYFSKLHETCVFIRGLVIGRHRSSENVTIATSTEEQVTFTAFGNIKNYTYVRTGWLTSAWVGVGGA